MDKNDFLFIEGYMNIGKDTVYDPSDHLTLIETKKQNDCTNKFVFEKVTTDKVEKIINNINIKKQQVLMVYLPK